MLNSNIIRWAYASAARHFQKVALKHRIPYYVEGDERNTHSLPEYIEFRMDGPYTLLPAKGEQYHFFDINVLASIALGSRNLYRSQEVCGLIYAGFNLTIPVHKYGDESQDDKSKIGCLKLRRELDQHIEVNQYGIIQQDTRIVQNTVEAHYRLVLDLVFLQTQITTNSLVTANFNLSTGSAASFTTSINVGADLTVT